MNTIRTPYGFGLQLDLPYEQAITKVTGLLREQGFGVLTEIDVQKTLREKLGADFRRYVILGVCNPQLAHRAFQAELEIGLLLPCNVVIHEEGAGSVVAFMDPNAAMSVVGNPAIDPIAGEALQRLQTVRDQLASL